MGLFDKIKAGLKKTRESISGSIETMLKGFSKIDEELFEELEELLVMGDVGIYTAEHICEELRVKVKKQGITDPAEVMGLIKEIVTEMLSGGEELQIGNKPAAILVIGVNGVGKTTTIGKLASRLKSEGNSVVLGAADTFRAAAIDQLEVWSERAGVPLVKRDEGSDPASVVFDTIAKAKSMKADILICDTAGRLHNKKNLMDELSKISRILNRELPDSDKEVLLVLDATTGQNAVNQAREFKNAAGITGIILTKLDGTAKGGVVLAIREELQLPVKFIGVGEKIDDLQPFDAQAFTEALFDNSTEVDDETAARIAAQNARYDAYGELVIDDAAAEKEWEEWETGTEAGDAAEEAKEIMSDIQDALKDVLVEEGLPIPEMLQPDPEDAVEEPAEEPAAALPEEPAAEPVTDETVVADEEPEHRESWSERRAREKAEKRAAKEAALREAEEAARQQREAEEEARRQHEAEEEARRQREAEEEARRQREAEEEARRQREAEEAAAMAAAEQEEPAHKESWSERRAREKAEKRAAKEAARLQREEAAAEEQEPAAEAEAPVYEEDSDGLTAAELEALERYESQMDDEDDHRESREERRARKEREKAEKRARKEAEKAERRSRR